MISGGFRVSQNKLNSPISNSRYPNNNAIGYSFFIKISQYDCLGNKLYKCNGNTEWII